MAVHDHRVELSRLNIRCNPSALWPTTHKVQLRCVAAEKAPGVQEHSHAFVLTQPANKFRLLLPILPGQRCMHGFSEVRLHPHSIPGNPAVDEHISLEVGLRNECIYLPSPCTDSLMHGDGDSDWQRLDHAVAITRRLDGRNGTPQVVALLTIHPMTHEIAGSTILSVVVHRHHDRLPSALRRVENRRRQHWKSVVNVNDVRITRPDRRSNSRVFPGIPGCHRPCCYLAQKSGRSQAIVVPP